MFSRDLKKVGILKTFSEEIKTSETIQSPTWRREARSRPIALSLNITNATHKPK